MTGPNYVADQRRALRRIVSDFRVAERRRAKRLHGLSWWRRLWAELIY